MEEEEEELPSPPVLVAMVLVVCPMPRALVLAADVVAGQRLGSPSFSAFACFGKKVLRCCCVDCVGWGTTKAACAKDGVHIS